MSAGKKAMPKTEDNDLAMIIRDLRAKLGLTQEQFAAKVGVTFSTVNRWESGRSRPSPLAHRRLCELLDKHSE
jgi:DNA-binding transcriptional regulator YiaG